MRAPRPGAAERAPSRQQEGAHRQRRPHARRRRHVASTDEAGLYQLYDGLNADDRYLRFFCGYRPTDEFFDKLANPRPGDARVVAELVDGHKQLIAEAGYSLLDNGNGEFAMVVARDWRGWLGPYLLDVVIDIAAANHVPNLEAEVLAANRTMLALLRARGSAFLEHGDCLRSRRSANVGIRRSSGSSVPPLGYSS